MKIQREDLHLISRHSNLTEQEIEKALQENVYNDREMWQKFLRLFFITLGIGFTTAGIIFFFAYNWEDLHKFAKIGLTEGLIIATTIIALLPKIKSSTRNIILTGSAFLVGVLFAVFGQIYQTGANAYDFFLAWTLFITLWVIVSNFAPLWLLYIVLINTTFILYSQQVVKDWSEILIVFILFFINTAFLIASVLLSKYKKIENLPNWFTTILALGSTTFATIGIIFGIMEEFEPLFALLIAIVLSVFSLGIWHGLQTKSGLYLSIIPLSVIIIASTLLLKISDGEGMLLFMTVFIIASVTGVILNLINLQKKWKNEK
jgi:uncharacterized membrane protein